MNQAPTSSSFSQFILKQLSHPVKLRIALCIAAIVFWQALFLSPLSDQVTATTARIGRERQRVATAREIDQLKKSLAPHRAMIGAPDDSHELMRYVVARIRSSPLRLVDLKPEKAKEIGPFDAAGLILHLEGAYGDIDQFLTWAETNKRLLRVDTLRITPNTREPDRLKAELTLLSLAEKAGPAAKPKTEPVKSR